MTDIKHAVVLATFGTCGLLAASAAHAWENLAKPQTEIRVGIGYLDSNAFWSGRYTGLNEDGLFLDLGLLLVAREPHDAEKPRYWRLEGRNLGLDSRSLRLDAGEQGQFSFFTYYRELPNHLYQDVGSPYLGAGGNKLTLPADGSKSTIADHLIERDLDTKRQRFGIGGRLNLDTRWRTSTALHYEHKEGIKARGIGGDFWGDQRSTLVPAPVDYETTRFETDLTYDGEKIQGRLAYQLSVFYQSDGDALEVADAHASNWATANKETVSLEPNNLFHQVSGSLGYSLGQTTRLSADLAIGRMLQDQNFVEQPITIPTASLNGRINTTLINLHANTRPHPNLNLRAGYRYDDRDNKTPQLIIDSLSTRPVSYEQSRYHLDVDYRLYKRTNLIASVVRDERERTFDDRKRTDETAYKIGARTRLLPRTSVGAEVSRAEQRGSNWERMTGPEALRKFYLADRDRTSAALFMSTAPIERLQLALRAEWVEDDYLRSELGLREATRNLLTIDAAYVPTDRLSIYTFWAYEQKDAEQAGRDESTGLLWLAERDDQMTTFGFGAEYTLIPKRLNLGLEAVSMSSRARMGPEDDPHPLLRSRLRQFSVYGDYAFSANMDIRFRYMVERYRENDWAIDGVGVTGVGDLILLDQESPDYTAHLIAAALRYRF